MIKFGPSGNEEAYYNQYKTSDMSSEYVKSLGLTAFEYSFGRGVNISDASCQKLGKTFSDNNIELSVHAPYFINLANEDTEMVLKSYKYLIDSAKKAQIFGAKRVIFHPSTQGKLDRKTAVELTKNRLTEFTNLVYKEGLNDICFCPETMGKLAQIGTIEEIVNFCAIDSIYLPTIDFGHINAREQGSLTTKLDYETRISYILEVLGERAKNFHIHFSKIEYTAKGEKKHLTFDDEVYGPDYKPMLQAIKSLKVEPVIICESSGTQARDAKIMKEYFESLK